MATKQHRQDLALGLTAIVILALFLGTVLFIYPMFHAPGRQIAIHFRHQDGMAPLKTGSLVILGGSLEVGRVLNVGLEVLDTPDAGEQEPQTVFVVQAEIDTDLPLHGDCEITTDQPAIGGSGYVSIINLGTPGVPLSEPIEGLPPQSLSAAIGTLSRRLLAEGGLVDDLTRAADPDVEGSVLYKVLASLDDLNAMTRELRTQLSPSDQKTLLGRLHRLLDDINVMTHALREEVVTGENGAMLRKVHLALDHLNVALGEAAGMLEEDRPIVKDVLTNVKRVTDAIDEELLATLRAQLDPANPASLISKLHTAMDHVNASLEDVEAMTAEGERMIVLSRPTLEKTLGNFQTMSAQLRLASQEVLLNPSKLIWGPGRQREEQLLVFQAARNFAQAASQLDDAAGRLEAVLKTLPPEGQVTAADNQELRAIQDAVRAAFQRFERAEEVLWERLK